MDDEPYLASMQDIGIPVFPDQGVADWERERGLASSAVYGPIG